MRGAFPFLQPYAFTARRLRHTNSFPVKIISLLVRPDRIPARPRHMDKTVSGGLAIQNFILKWVRSFEKRWLLGFQTCAQVSCTANASRGNVSFQNRTPVRNTIPDAQHGTRRAINTGVMTGNRSEGLLILQSAVLRLDPIFHRVHETSDSRA